VRTANAKGQPVDVMLMDVQITGLDGYEAIRMLRAEGFANAIVAITAAAMKEDRENVWWQV
jgi:CheY-like chemotaxis protein